jgi:hypothetical protein
MPSPKDHDHIRRGALSSFDCWILESKLRRGRDLEHVNAQVLGDIATPYVFYYYDLVNISGSRNLLKFRNVFGTVSFGGAFE